MPIFQRQALATLLLALLTACATPGTPPPEPTLEERADSVLARVRVVEPELTAQLIELSEELQSSLIKLEHRFKTRESLLRKLRKLRQELPPGTPIHIYDALRYTIQCDDDPSGHYVQCVQRVLGALAEEGHEVVKLKNYWKRGDNYSGINVVIAAPGDLRWELQFHTQESLAANARNRDRYEALRTLDTPIEKRRELYDAMAQEWETVAIPEGALAPDLLHPKAERRVYPRP